ncbi:glycosyltransferase family 4 protein [Novosphingobium aerophilum]|uniref:glycosyltransferase family 4 protein n=1 Tax=Novosphingobium TaxID=165696 RepID=UPI002D764EB3|nr:glycosyltransferase family 4 protein [Novosphingobium sp. RL4]WRT94089.1 glycosyltransferase family 4 protein [Novosphingobium sp. RL4]
MNSLAAPVPLGGEIPARGRTGGPLTICFPFAGDELGGSHVSARGLMEGLDQARYRLLVVPEVPDGTIAEFFGAFTRMPDPAAPRRSFVPGARFGPGKVLRALAGVPRRARFLREHGIDVVHSNDGRSHASWALAARLAGARLVWHHRGDPDARGLRFVAPLLASRIFTVSRFSLPQGSSEAARAAQVVYSPFDTSVSADWAAMRARIVEELGCPPDALLCGWFGNFVKRKRPLEFVEAVERLGAMLDRPVVGLMFGDPRNTEVGDALPERIARVSGNARVHMMGYRSPGHEWLAGCDLLLVPAAREPLGRTLVEAMLVGTLVVATDSGGNPEALEGGCGVLCPLDDPAAMARAAADLLADPERIDAIRRHARLEARRRFSKENHVRQVSTVYEELARG